MRTLRLTDEEFETITRALGIAEAKFEDMRKQYIETLVNIRGVYSPTRTANNETNIMLEHEHMFANLSLEMQAGEKDV